MSDARLGPLCWRLLQALSLTWRREHIYHNQQVVSHLHALRSCDVQRQGPGCKHTHQDRCSKHEQRSTANQACLDPLAGVWTLFPPHPRHRWGLIRCVTMYLELASPCLSHSHMRKKSQRAVHWITFKAMSNQTMQSLLRFVASVCRGTGVTKYFPHSKAFILQQFEQAPTPLPIFPFPSHSHDPCAKSAIRFSGLSNERVVDNVKLYWIDWYMFTCTPLWPFGASDNKHRYDTCRKVLN